MNQSKVAMSFTDEEQLNERLEWLDELGIMYDLDHVQINDGLMATHGMPHAPRTKTVISIGSMDFRRLQDYMKAGGN
jgi:hypothetical protein